MVTSHDEVAALYRQFATDEVRGISPLYDEVCTGIAGDAQVLELIGTLPRPKWQPNLLLGAWKLVHGVASGYPEFRERLLDEPEAVLSVMRTHATQTNEAARCATTLPVLASIDGPIALFEVGVSAGLCLFPDRYHYRYVLDDDTFEVGEPSGVDLTCVVQGPMPVPTRLPEVVWRGGIDLNPLDIRDDETVRWLRALIWPEQTERLERLDAAIAIARTERTQVVTGNADEQFEAALAAVPRAATLVVLNTATAMYFTPEARERFAERANRAGVWISQEAPGVLPSVAAMLPVRAPRGRFVLSRNGEPLAFTAPHGGTIDWIE